MKAWSNWFADLLPQLPGCSDPQVEHELLRACQDFFSRSRAWQVIQSPVAIYENQPDFEIDMDDSGQELVRVEAAWLDGKRLGVKTVGDMDDAFADDWQAHTGAVSSLVQITPGTVLFYPIPVSASVIGLKLRLSVKPSETATGVPDDIFSRFKDPIAAGTRARLMLQPKQECSNPILGQFNADLFESAINTATINAARSFGAGRIASRPKFC